jgi:hypothetical protein
MSDAKPNEKGDRQDHVPDQVLSPGAQEARVAGAGDMASIEKQRTNASDGSLRKYSADQIAAQNQSIELVYEGRIASRTEKKTERELLREMANKPENVNTQGLESIAKDQSLPEDKRILASMIQEMRTQSKALGTPTDALDAYAREALQAELLAKSKAQSPQIDDQESCGSFSYAAEKNSLTVGSHTYASDQLLAQGSVQNEVVSDATNARATDVPHEKTLLYGHVSEPDPWDKVAALPEKTQAEIVLTAIRANAEHWGREQVQRQIGSLMGATEGVGQILQDMATITDFNHACLTGDKKTASEMGAAFGDSIGRMLVGGVNILKISDQYLQDLGAQGDWTKPAKDLARLNQTLNTAWDELSPMEQERLKSRFITEFAANAAMPGASARLLKAGKFTEVFPNMVKIACQSGAELKQLPGDLRRARQGFRNFFDDMFAPEAVTPDGQRIKLTSEVKQHYMMNQSDNFEGGVKPHSSKRPKDAPKAKPVLEEHEAVQFALDGIPAKIGFSRTMELRSELRDACRAMKLDIDTKNIAYAEIKIGGKSSKLVAINGEKSPAGTVGMPSDPKFETIPDGAMPRDRDSEYKILESIAEHLSPDAVGEIRLFSEQKPCDPSCQYVISKFQKEFPGIKLKTTWAFETKNEREWAVFEEIERDAARNPK